MNINFNKTTTVKLKKLRKDIEKNEAIENKELLEDKFEQMLKKEIKNLKGCSERAVVDFYLGEFRNDIDCNRVSTSDEYFAKLQKNTRNKISRHYSSQKTFNNNIDIYFNDVKREYIMHPQSESNELEFLPENRDIFIKNNLKLVVNCAKRYQNLGIPFDDLIQAGNLGLCVAFDKFDTNRAKLRKKMIENINDFNGDDISFEDANSIINNSFEYSKNLDSTVDKLPDEGFSSKDDFINWTKKNVKTAVFASVAFQWIRAYILTEISKNGKIIKAPKSNDEDENKTTVNIISLDSINPYTNDCYQDDILSPITNEEFAIEDENLENMEKQDMFKKIVTNALYKLPSLDARILKKRFGIGLPYQLSINEIAESENMNPNKVKYSISSSLKTIAANISDEDKQIIVSLIE